MAKILCEFDTKEKTLAVSIDGTDVPDVCEVVMFKGYDSENFTVSLTSKTEYEEMGFHEMKRIVAKQSVEGKSAFSQGEAKTSTYQDFYEVDPTYAKMREEMQEMTSGLIKRK